MKKLLKKLVAFLKKLLEKADDTTPTPSPSPSPSSLKVQNCYGGFKFENAKEDSTAQIQNLTVTSKGMKYGWKSGSSLKGWGLADTDASALAVFAVKGSDGVYRGGKFDWISKSRTTRSFENIRGGYHGHVGMYISNGYVLQSSADRGVHYPRAGVRITKLTFRSSPQGYASPLI